MAIPPRVLVFIGVGYFFGLDDLETSWVDGGGFKYTRMHPFSIRVGLLGKKARKEAQPRLVGRQEADLKEGASVEMRQHPVVGKLLAVR